MAKIGTAHVEIKPVLDEAALAAITERLSGAITAAVQKGVAEALQKRPEYNIHVLNTQTPEETAAAVAHRMRWEGERGPELVRLPPDATPLAAPKE